MHIYLVAFNTNSVESLARAKLKFSAATNAYINKTDDQLQFPAAAVQDGYSCTSCMGYLLSRGPSR